MKNLQKRWERLGNWTGSVATLRGWCLSYPLCQDLRTRCGYGSKITPWEQRSVSIVSKVPWSKHGCYFPIHNYIIWYKRGPEDGDSPVDRGWDSPSEIGTSHDAISGPMNPSLTMAVWGWNSVAKSSAKARIVAVDWNGWRKPPPSGELT